ncbi:hypothetical protein [uncultured Fusobacterium sp.]|nr:hypothetical protein [uncultured Fusobacterium sp.]
MYYRELKFMNKFGKGKINSGRTISITNLMAKRTGGLQYGR